MDRTAIQGQLRYTWLHDKIKEVQDIIQGADIVKFTKSIRFRWYDQVERMPNQIMPRQTATTTMEHGKEEDRVKDGETSWPRI
jgi:hypothetical protein